MHYNVPFACYADFQVGTDFVTDRDFAALDFLDNELLGDNRPERPYEETLDYGLEKLVTSNIAHLLKRMNNESL